MVVFPAFKPIRSPIPSPRHAAPDVMRASDTIPSVGVGDCMTVVVETPAVTVCTVVEMLSGLHHAANQALASRSRHQQRSVKRLTGEAVLSSAFWSEGQRSWTHHCTLAIREIWF